MVILLLETYTEFVGLGAGVLTAASMIPQVVKTFKEKKASQLSTGMILLLIAGIGLWIWYGILRKDMPIMLTNAFSMAINILMVILRIRYRNNRSS